MRKIFQAIVGIAVLFGCQAKVQAMPCLVLTSTMHTNCPSLKRTQKVVKPAPPKQATQTKTL